MVSKVFVLTINKNDTISDGFPGYICYAIQIFLTVLNKALSCLNKTLNYMGYISSSRGLKCPTCPPQYSITESIIMKLENPVHFFKFDLNFQNFVPKLNQCRHISMYFCLIQFHDKIPKNEVKLEKMNMSYFC